MGQLEGKVAIVTGAAGGLGRAFAQALAAEGARLVCADINQNGAAETAGLIHEAGSEAIAVEVNVTDEVSTQRMARAAIDAFGRIDILINNAAIYAGLERKPFWEISTETWDKVLEVNVKGAWLCSKSVFPHMKEHGGKIIHISSATFFSGSPQWLHYVTSKGAIVGMTRGMAREVGDYGINVNAIAPGFTLTAASLNLIDNAAGYGVDRGAIKRGSHAEDIVGTAVYLASPASNFVTGQTIIVDGGRQFN